MDHQLIFFGTKNFMLLLINKRDARHKLPRCFSATLGLVCIVSDLIEFVHIPHFWQFDNAIEQWRIARPVGTLMHLNKLVFLAEIYVVTVPANISQIMPFKFFNTDSIIVNWPRKWFWKIYILESLNGVTPRLTIQ